MVSGQSLTDTQLEILHDHYKDTFALVRAREHSRDRLFLVVIGLFALLALEIGYPAEFSGALRTVNIADNQIDLRPLPLPALLSATWVLTLAVALRYCQTSIAVDRQYPYVHDLEDVISPQLGGGTTYRREGRVYLDKYPMLLDVAWFAYVVLFPVIAVAATAALILWEWQRLPHSLPHRIFDTGVALALIGFFVLYRVQPYVAAKVKQLRSKH